jgi:acetolactate synthase-1/2/3 large subunit
MTTVGEQIVRFLEAAGVDTVFGIPGSHNLPIFRGLAASPIRLVSPRHEQGAGFAADGYARSSGRPGVFVTTTGPGILNAMTALATSYADSIPVLAISPGAALADEGQETGWLHESKNQHGAVDAVVGRSIRCRTARQVQEELAGVFARWQVERPRPVHLEIPLDLLAAEIEDAELAQPWILSAPVPQAAVLSEAADALAAATNVLIIAGGGARAARAEITELSALLDAPVATTRAGAGLLDRGVDLPPLVTTALPYAPDVLDSYDAVLVIGSELARRDLPAAILDRVTTVVRIDIDSDRMSRTPGRYSLIGDARATTALLIERLRGIDAGRPTTDRAAKQVAIAESVQRAWPGPLRGFHETLRSVLPADAVVAGDSSQVSYLGAGPHLAFPEPRSFLYPDAFAPLGFGLPAAIGAALACPGRATFAIVGDGAFGFSLQELATAVEEALPIIVVVVENGGYREIEEEMVAAGIPPVGVRLHAPDVVALATAFGADAARISAIEEIAPWVAALKEGAALPAVLVIDEALFS